MKVLESYQTKADTYRPESACTPKSPAFFWQIKQPIFRSGCRVLYEWNVKNLCRVWRGGDRSFKTRNRKEANSCGQHFWVISQQVAFHCVSV